MKKMIALFMLTFCLNIYVQAQIDTNKTMDTSRMASKQNKMNRNHAQDSNNAKKKMPPKTMMSADSAVTPQKMSPGMKGKSASRKS
ncbi:MAG: hypothetical protein ABI402_08375 [Ferruginibacter sp.]